MTRPLGVVADAVAAVIAAAVQRELLALGVDLPERVALVLGTEAVVDVRREGWHISSPITTAAEGRPDPMEHRMIINLSGEPVRLYGPDVEVIDDDPADALCTVIPADGAAAYLDLLDLGSPGDDVHGGRLVHIDLVEFYVRGLPAPRPGTRLIVPYGVALATRGRSDLLVPVGDVRDRSGEPVGHQLLASPC